MLIRPEEGRDRDVIAAVHESAFRGPEEARLVGLLRDAGKAEIALVAVDVAVDVNGDDRVVGHVVFSPVAVERSPGGAKVLGLGPVGVLPAYQRQGVGRALIERGLETCEVSGCDAVVVLGDPAYYRRFGFRRASDYGLGNEYDADDAFMARSLREGGLDGLGGVVRYATEFASG